MPVSVRPVKGDPFDVDISENSTVQALKTRIAQLRPEMPAENQKLLYAGRILQNSVVIKDINIKENARIVVMVSGCKRPHDSTEEGGYAASTPTANTPTPMAPEPSVPADRNHSIATPEATNPQSTVTVETVDPSMPGVASATDASAGMEPLLPSSACDEDVLPTPIETGGDWEAAAAQLCEMGFQRGDVERCLALAFGNPDRAAEYLMGGIPPHVHGENRAQYAQTLAADMEAVAATAQTQRMEAMRDLTENAGALDPGQAMLAENAGALDPGEAMLAALQAVAGGNSASWEVEVDHGWRPFVPGVPFQGNNGEVVSYQLGRHAYAARFDGVGGVQTNVATQRRRRIRRAAGALPAATATLPAPAPMARPVPGPCGREALPPVQPHEIEFVVPFGELSGAVSHGQHVRSHSISVGDFTFRLLVFPRGTASTQGQHVSAFVEAAVADGTDERWFYKGVKYQIAMVNWIDYRQSIVKVDTFNFSKEAVDRGWHDMVRVDHVCTESGWLGPDDSLLFRACVRCPETCSIQLNSEYKSKTETGYVNLKVNQLTHIGALLQSLAHTSALKKLVSSATLASGGLSPPPAEVLQTLLRELETSENGVCAMHLVRALGWDEPRFQEFDPSFLLQSLCDSVAQHIPAVRNLFEIELQAYIECCDVEFSSVRTERVNCLRLNIQAGDGRKLHSVDESLQNLLVQEVLDGDNAYDAEGHGKQRAHKGIRIKKLPPVLLLELGRTCFDASKMEVRKLSTKFEFSTDLSLSTIVPGAGLYRLHAVIIHSGDHERGEYCAHIRPTADDESGENRWFTFTEEAILPCSSYAAIDASFGGEDLNVWNYFDRLPEQIPRTPVKPRSSCACALVYVQTGARPTCGTP